MTSDPTWNFLDPASKPRILAVLRREADALLQLAADPARWHAPTACAGWDLRDMIGHLVDATEGYLAALDVTRNGASAAEPVGIRGMAEASDRAARAFRSVPREEVVERLRRATDLFIDEFDGMSDNDWSGLIVPEPYLGPLPAMIIVIGLLGGYAVHGWDVRQGLGGAHAIAADAADLLVPFMFLLWGATADTTVVTAPYAIGIRTTGRNGGETNVQVTKEGLTFASGSLQDCAAVMELDPGTLILTAYNRVNAGTVHGDRALATDFRSLFVAI